MFKSALAVIAAVFALSILSPAVMAAKGGPYISLTALTDNIELELDKQGASVSVQGFVDCMNNGLYNDTTFHRVIPGFMIQGSGFAEQMQQKKPDSLIKNEVDNGLHDAHGTIMMARIADEDGATSQFFISAADNAFLDHGQCDSGYTVFGRVVKGMSVADKISRVPTHDVGSCQNVSSKLVITLSAKALP